MVCANKTEMNITYDLLYIFRKIISNSSIIFKTPFGAFTRGALNLSSYLEEPNGIPIKKINKGIS